MDKNTFVENTEKKDCLNRGPMIDHLESFIDHYKEQKSSSTLGIDGKWGSGKSFILETIKSDLNGDYLIFHYNCWQYDYYEEPLIAIVSMMIQQIQKNTSIKEDKQALLNDGISILALFVTIMSIPVEKFTTISGNEILQTLDAWGSINGRKNYDKFFDFNEVFSLLIDFINTLSKETGKTVLFLVDELDRCLPEYAIKVLERLHHISENLEKSITVIAVDRKEMLISVQHAFGYNKDESEKFLRKFVEFFIKIDNGILNNNIYFNHNDLYFDKFVYGNNIVREEKITDFMKIIFKDLVIRDQEYIIDISNFIHSRVLAEIRDDGEEKQLDYNIMFAELLVAVSYLFYDIDSYYDIKTRIDIFSSDYIISCDSWTDFKYYIDKKLNEYEADIIKKFARYISIIVKSESRNTTHIQK